MRLATWNVNSLTARMPRVTQWIEENEPDVLCLQETKQADDKFPSKEFLALGYESAHYGDGRWNGVALLSRVGVADEARGFGTPLDDHGCRLVAATCGGIRQRPGPGNIDHIINVTLTQGGPLYANMRLAGLMNLAGQTGQTLAY